MRDKAKKVTHRLCAAGIAINTALAIGYTVADNITMLVFSVMVGACCWVGFFQTHEDEKNNE